MQTQQNSIEVTDGEGWRRTIALEKSITHIGNDPGNDIHLARPGGQPVPPWCMQLIALPTSPPSYRLVNLGDTAIFTGANGQNQVNARSMADIVDGEYISVGGFDIVLHCPEGSLYGTGETSVSGEGLEETGSSQNIRLEISLPQRAVSPSQPEVKGSVTVCNLGDKSQVQFNLEVEGLEPECFRIGAGPLLSPSAEREVAFHLLHPRAPTPPAGKYPFRVHATADAYPSERATVSQIVHILPFYDHDVTFGIDNEQT